MGAVGPTGPQGPPAPFPDAGAVPTHPPGNLSFADADLARGTIGGALSLGKATDESDVLGYALYFGADATTKLQSTPIVVFAKTGSDLAYTFRRGTPLPAGARTVLAYSMNASGEMSVGSWTNLADNYDVIQDLVGDPMFPTGAWIDGAGNLVVAGVSGVADNFTTFYRCNIDGTSCVTHPAGGPYTTVHGIGDLDPTNGRLVVAGMSVPTAGNPSKPLITSCALDGSSCMSAVAPADPSWTSIDVFRLRVDALHAQVLLAGVASASNIFQAVPVLFRCSLDLSVCDYHDLSAAQPPAQIFIADLVVAPQTGDIVTAVSNCTSGPCHMLAVDCRSDGTSCVANEVSSTFASGTPFLRLFADGARRELFVPFTNNQSLGLDYCKADGSGCIAALSLDTNLVMFAAVPRLDVGHIDLAGDGTLMHCELQSGLCDVQGLDPAVHPSAAVLDPTGTKLLVVGWGTPMVRLQTIGVW